MPVSRESLFAPAVLTTWGCDDEGEAEDVPFAVAVAVAAAVTVGVTTPAAEVEQTGLATRLVRLGQASSAEFSCDAWAL